MWTDTHAHAPGAAYLYKTFETVQTNCVGMHLITFFIICNEFQNI